ncbi:MAG: class I SAM-dependent methyltransferase [Deltaproteobacteria bacterium]|nr:MAG: class I SAM-dependent methyltransferase [Deltaproteobacteria bacterium]
MRSAAGLLFPRKRQPAPPSGLHSRGTGGSPSLPPHPAATVRAVIAARTIVRFRMRPGNGITGFAASSDAMCGQAHRWLYTSASRVYVPLLDRLLYRHPFEGGSARRYARDERPAFGDLDDRLLDHLAPELAGAARLLDVGCGPGTFARRAAERFAALDVVAIEPSRDFARPGVVRAAGEALPLADRSVDVAICLSSIRHVRDRAATLGELRRVRLGWAMLRPLFGPLVVRTAPPAAAIAVLAEQAGFSLRRLRPDPVQPVYVMELQ